MVVYLPASACNRYLWILHFACRRLESREGEIGEEIFCNPAVQGGEWSERRVLLFLVVMAPVVM